MFEDWLSHKMLPSVSLDGCVSACGRDALDSGWVLLAISSRRLTSIHSLRPKYLQRRVVASVLLNALASSNRENLHSDSIAELEETDLTKLFCQLNPVATFAQPLASSIFR